MGKPPGRAAGAYSASPPQTTGMGHICRQLWTRGWRLPACSWSSWFPVWPAEIPSNGGRAEGGGCKTALLAAVRIPTKGFGSLRCPVLAQPWLTAGMGSRCLARSQGLQAAGGFVDPLATVVMILLDIGAKRRLGSPNHSPALEIGVCLG